MRLRRYLYNGQPDEALMVRSFLRGLRPEIWGRLQAVTYGSVNELTERAVNVEEGISHDLALRLPNQRRRISCYFRGEEGHRSNVCPSKKSHCYWCGTQDHYSHACPSKPTSPVTQHNLRPPPISGARGPSAKRQAKGSYVYALD